MPDFTERIIMPLQTAIERIYEITKPDDWRVAATCHGLMIGYHHRWAAEQADIELLEVETTYTAPLTNIDTGRRSRTYTIAGKLDKIIERDGGTVLVDHKTTSSDISDPTGSYWRQLAVDSQASHYEILLLSNGIRLSNILWDVVRKPGIKPKQVAAKERERILAEQTYCGYAVSTESLDYLITETRENAELYAARLAAETISDPDKYFARRSNPRTRSQLAEYSGELWATAKDIRATQLSKRHTRNSGACFNYGTPCKFLGLCSDTDTPDSENWQKKPKKHAELPDGIGGRSVLTNSRLRTFHTCRRKHFYEYELGIERVDAERREALHFGNVWHEAQDAWWRAMNERKSNGNRNEQSSSSGDSQATQLA